MKKFLLFTLLIWQGFILSANDSTWYTLTDADIVMDGNGEILQYTPVTSDRHIIIPDTLHGQAVVSIRDGIFENGMYRGVFQYKSITGVQFPSTLKKIGTYAFDLGQITELHIPEGVEYIGRNAFDSQKIIKLSLPSTLKHLGGSAFTENKIDTFNFWPPLLDTIPNAAFSKNPNLKVVNIPAHVTFIAGGVFWNCDSLSVINFESGSKLKHIGVRAFRGCAIDQLDLPQEIDTIDEEAFYRNPMSDLQLPMGLRYIGRRCFNENNIKRLNVPATIEHFGLDCFSENDINEVNLAEGLKETGSYALNNISSIIVPDGIEELSPSAFAGNPLTSLVLPDSMRVLGEGALSDTYLSQIPIPPLVQEIPKDYCDNTLVENMFIPARIKSIGNYAFNGCARLQSIEFENGSACTTLGDGVFKDCTALDSITLPDSLEYLGKGAFKGCASLVNIELPHKIQSIRAETFSGCTNIAKFNFGGVKKIYKKAFYKSGIKELTIPKSIEAIYSQAFAYSNIDSLHITAGVDIGYSAFGFCELEKVSFDPECTTVNGLDNNNLKSVNLPDSVKTIESRAFYQNNLTEIDLKNVEIIHNQAFAGNKLDTVILPETISFIKKYAFDANYITSFQLPGNGQWLSSSGKVYPGGSHVSNLKVNYLRLDKPPKLEIRLFDTNGVAIPHGIVMSSLVDSAFPVSESGEVILPILPGKNIELTIMANGYKDTTLMINHLSNNGQLDINLLPEESTCSRVTLKVTDGEKPLKNVWLYNQYYDLDYPKWYVLTNNEGVLVLENVLVETESYFELELEGYKQKRITLNLSSPESYHEITMERDTSRPWVCFYCKNAPGGTINFDTHTGQCILPGESSTPVTATPDTGYYFYGWFNTLGDLISKENPLVLNQEEFFKYVYMPIGDNNCTARFGKLPATDTSITRSPAISETNKREILVYPNPANNHITVKGQDIRLIEIFTLSGTLVHSKTHGNQMNINHLTAGSYIIRVTSLDNTLSWSKLNIFK